MRNIFLDLPYDYIQIFNIKAYSISTRLLSATLYIVYFPYIVVLAGKGRKEREGKRREGFKLPAEALDWSMEPDC